MKRVTQVLGASVAALLLSGAAWADAGHHDPVSATQIEAAKTAADHEAIAQAYEAEATAASDKAVRHEAMAQAYRAGGAPKGHRTSVVGHCERLVEQYQAIAEENRQMAAAHRGMAKDCCKKD